MIVLTKIFYCKQDGERIEQLSQHVVIAVF